MKKVLDSFMNDLSSNFDEYISRNIVKNLNKREDYSKLIKEKQEIFEEYEAVLDLFENDVFKGYSKKEAEAISKIFGINAAMDMLEEREIFKLGAKETYIFFEEQNMLNI